MLDRKIILRVLLAALGLAAVTGAMAVLVGTGDIVGRVAFTALLVAVACGLILPVSMMIDHASKRPAGLVGMAVIIAEFLLGLSLIWHVGWWPAGGGWWGWEEKIAVTMVALAVAGPLAMGFTRLAGSPGGRVAGCVGILVAAVGFLLAVLPTWPGPFFGGSTYLEEHLWETNLAWTPLGLLAAGALVGMGVPPPRYWRWLGVLTAIAAFCMALVGIWGTHNGGEAIFTTVISIAVVVAHANLVLFCPLKPGQRWLALGTIGFAIFTAAMLDAEVFDVLRGSDGWARLAAAGGVMTACGTLALLVLARINRGVNLEHATRSISDIALTCPRCQRKQTLPLGNAACSACGLRIFTQVEEPRCAKCGYNLYMLTSDRCPECGEPIAAPPAALAARPA